MNSFGLILPQCRRMKKNDDGRSELRWSMGWSPVVTFAAIEGSPVARSDKMVVVVPSNTAKKTDPLMMMCCCCYLLLLLGAAATCCSSLFFCLEEEIDHEILQ